MIKASKQSMVVGLWVGIGNTGGTYNVRAKVARFGLTSEGDI